MRRIEKILALVMALVFFASQLAYANSFTDFWTRSKWSKGVQGWASRNKAKIAASALGPVGIAGYHAGKAVASTRQGKAAIKWLGNNKFKVAAAAAGPVGVAGYYAGRAASRTKQGQAARRWVSNNKTNIAAGTAGAATTAIGGPIAGAAVGTGAARSRVFRGWVTNMFVGKKKISSNSY